MQAKPYEGNEPYIFVSYSHKDEIVQDIINRLYQDNYRIWWDEGIYFGNKWKNAIAKCLKNCHIFIAFISKNYDKSENCNVELEYAVDNHKIIVNIYLENIKLSSEGLEMYVKPLQAIKKYKCKNDEEFYEKLYSTKTILLCTSYVNKPIMLTDYSDGNKYTGGLKNGRPNGQGKWTFSDGMVYEGELKDGKFDGKGKMTKSDGTIYEGDFKNGNWNGIGRTLCPDGTVYEGEYKDGYVNGKGKMTKSNGIIYEGRFKNGIPNGRGKLTFQDGSFYKGEFKDGKYNGYGELKIRYGNNYKGEFKDGQYNGYGKLIYMLGMEYDGEFRNGKYDGKGILITPDGMVSDGEFKDGKFVGGQRYYNEMLDELKNENFDEF